MSHDEAILQKEVRKILPRKLKPIAPVFIVLAIVFFTLFISRSNTAPSQPVLSNSYSVDRVVDGDTIVVSRPSESEQKVRLIGINSPESVDPRRAVQCYGKEASDYLKLLLTGKQVTLVSDASQSDRDKYDRLLRYVFLDTENINQRMIADGYAYEYTYDVPYKYQLDFKSAQNNAEINRLGLWSKQTCSGQK